MTRHVDGIDFKKDGNPGTVDYLHVDTNDAPVETNEAPAGRCPTGRCRDFAPCSVCVAATLKAKGGAT